MRKQPYSLLLPAWWWHFTVVMLFFAGAATLVFLAMQPFQTDVLVIDLGLWAVVRVGGIGSILFGWMLIYGYFFAPPFTMWLLLTESSLLKNSWPKHDFLFVMFCHIRDGLCFLGLSALLLLIYAMQQLPVELHFPALQLQATALALYTLGVTLSAVITHRGMVYE